VKTKRHKIKIGELLNTKTGKYFMARQKGKSKKESALVAGFPESTAAHNTDKIEQSVTFNELTVRYKDKLLEKITLDQIAEAHADNILQTGQERIDRAARNTAIAMAKDAIEPKDTLPHDEGDKVLIVLSK
jgi:hypothetical protein